jgi:tRNA 2-thiocytidine biosynthesis protein TtcA
MLSQWERQFPGRIESIFGAIQNVSLSQLADTTLFDFKALGNETMPLELEDTGDIDRFIRAINV